MHAHNFVRSFCARNFCIFHLVCAKSFLRNASQNLVFAFQPVHVIIFGSLVTTQFVELSWNHTMSQHHFSHNLKSSSSSSSSWGSRELSKKLLRWMWVIWLYLRIRIIRWVADVFQVDWYKWQMNMICFNFILLFWLEDVSVFTKMRGHCHDRLETLIQFTCTDWYQLTNWFKDRLPDGWPNAPITIQFTATVMRCKGDSTFTN